AAMGASIADVDLDGDMDILVTNMFSSAGRRIATQGDRFMNGKAKDVQADYVRHARGNTLLRNNGDGTFTDSTDDSGMAIGGWAWGAQFVDINNDGFDDIYSPNGFLTNKGEDDL
ncbi:MAG: VCBS repeat-containing protein, partial [Planctomycetota bacterium]